MKFDEDSYRVFRQQLGQDILEIPYPFKHKRVCVALSGGLDSSVVLAMYKKLRPDITSYSIGFRNMHENMRAERVAGYFRVKHKSIIVSKKEYIKACKEIIKLKKEPLQVPNEALLYLIAKQFKKDIGNDKGVILSGEGCDELFGGYTNILETIPTKGGNLMWDYIHRISYDNLAIHMAQRGKVKKWAGIFIMEQEGKTNYDIVQNWLIKLHMPALLQRLSTVKYVKGIDYHCPFLETSWLYFYKVLPREFRTNKMFLRLIFSRVLPGEVLEAEKVGFALPIDLNRWQSWNLEVWKTGKSKIDFWK